jgi:hypothetical protein
VREWLEQHTVTEILEVQNPDASPTTRQAEIRKVLPIDNFFFRIYRLHR